MNATPFRRFVRIAAFSLAGYTALVSGAIAPALGECRTPARYSPDRLFVFDASGSMEKWVDYPTYTRLGLAKDLMAAMTTRLAVSRPPTRAGLLTFGARERDAPLQPASCRDIRLDVPLAPAPDALRRIGAVVGTVEPKGGATAAEGGRSPLFDAITAAGRALPPGQGGNIVIVTDMERNEACLPSGFTRYDRSAMDASAQQAIVCRALDAAFAASGQPSGALRIQFIVGPGLVDDRDRMFLDQLGRCADAKVMILTPSNLRAVAEDMAGQIADCVERPVPPAPPAPDIGPLRVHLIPSELPPELGPEAFDPAPLGLRIEWMWRNARQRAEVKGIDVPISTPGEGTTTFSVVDGDQTVTKAVVTTTSAGGQVAIAVPLGAVEASLAGAAEVAGVRWEFERGAARFARRGSTTIRQTLPPGAWKVRAIVTDAGGREAVVEGTVVMRLGTERVDLRLAPPRVIEEATPPERPARLRFAGIRHGGATLPSSLELAKAGGEHARLVAGEEQMLAAGDWAPATSPKIDLLPPALRLGADERATFEVHAGKARLRGDAPAGTTGEMRWTLVDATTRKTTEIRGSRLDLVVDPGDYEVLLRFEETERRQRVVAKAEHVVVLHPQ
jgi:hypothetical protein